MTAHTAPSQPNSMAAGLSAAMSVIIWLSVIVGLLALALLVSGLVAIMNGGEVELPGLAIENTTVSAAELITALAALVVVLPGIVFICMQLRRILSTLAAGDPFVPENSNRLTKIAGTIAMMEVGRQIAIFLLRQFVDFGPSAELPSYSINLISWSAAIAFFVLSHVFREGTRLRADAKMTI